MLDSPCVLGQQLRAHYDSAVLLDACLTHSIIHHHRGGWHSSPGSPRKDGSPSRGIPAHRSACTPSRDIHRIVPSARHRCDHFVTSEIDDIFDFRHNNNFAGNQNLENPPRKDFTTRLKCILADLEHQGSILRGRQR